MKLAVLSESAADEAAVRLLVDGIRGIPCEPVAFQPLRTRGWPAVLQVLPKVLQRLHYGTDADALVVVVDSNTDPIHELAHEQPGGTDGRCRICLLRASAHQVSSRLSPVAGRSPIRLGLGLAVPAIEAWFRCGHDRHVTEAAWLQALQSGQYPYDKKQLKRDVYGTDRLSLPLEQTRMVAEAQRLAQNVAELEKWFPNGFGLLAREVRGW